MGFPLSKGTVKDSVLTCHWHHGRFDLNTFDQWAGDVHFFPVEIRNENEVWVNVSYMPSKGVNSYEMLLQKGLTKIFNSSLLKLLSQYLNRIKLEMKVTLA